MKANGVFNISIQNLSNRNVCTWLMNNEKRQSAGHDVHENRLKEQEGCHVGFVDGR